MELIQRKNDIKNDEIANGIERTSHEIKNEIEIQQDVIANRATSKDLNWIRDHKTRQNDKGKL